MKKSIIQVSILIIFFTFLLASLAPNTVERAWAAEAQKKIVWKTQLIFGSGTVFADYYRMWVKRVNEITGGRLVLEAHYAGEIVGPFEQFDAVRSGVLDAGYSWTGYWFGKFPAGIFFAGVPGGLRVKDYYTWLFEHGGLSLWEEIYDKFNIKPMPIATYANEIFCWSNKPLRSLDDFKGLKIRQSGIWVEGLKMLGASPVTMAGPEIVPSMERGVIDAAEFSTVAQDFSMGLPQVAKYAHFPSVHQPGTYMELLINKNSWKALPDDLKNLLEASIREALFETWIKAENDSAKALIKIKEAGVKVVKLSPEIQKRVMELSGIILKKYSEKDPMFAKVYKSQTDYRNFIKEYKELMRIEGE